MSVSRVAILGSTGSIGQNTLNVIQQHPHLFEVVALSAYSSVDLLLSQCIAFKPEYAVMVNTEAAEHFKNKMASIGLKTRVLTGEAGLNYIAQLPQVDKVVAAIVGGAGLVSTYSAVQAGKTILLANKETLVMAGDFLINCAQVTGAVFLPVDSEHNALFQCMPSGYVTGKRPEGVRRLVLTASGGAFLNKSITELHDVTPQQACEHPNWKMGKKITVDCATLMNKGLEVIEACRIFRMNADEIEVLIHPQSVIHSLVEYLDGSFLAQLGVPDMRVPISNCLGWPTRIESGAQPLSLSKIRHLSFFDPDLVQFPCLGLAFAALKSDPAMSIVVNASNEVAVSAFLNEEIRFTDIAYVVEKTMNENKEDGASSLEEILYTDMKARIAAKRVIEHKMKVVSA